MKKLHHASRVAAILGLAAVACVAARPAEAGLFHRNTVVVAPSAYVVPAPVTTVYAAPVVATSVVATPVASAPVPAMYTIPAVASAPVQAVYAPTSAVVASPIVPTMYAAPVVIRGRVVNPRRVYYLVP